MEAESPSSIPVIEHHYHPGCIAVGWSGIICQTGDTHVIKHPKHFANSQVYNEQFRDLITLEREIYERLGDHEGIIRYLGVEDEDTGAIKPAFANQGELATHVREHEIPPPSFRIRWMRSLVDTFHHVYRCKVLHQDIKLNNILVDQDTLKVIDFANGALFPLDADMEAACADDPLTRVDLLCLGCVLYSIAAWHVFAYDYFEAGGWPTVGELPSTSGVICEGIIRKCWEDKYSTVASLNEDMTVWSEQSQDVPSLETETAGKFTLDGVGRYSRGEALGRGTACG